MENTEKKGCNKVLVVILLLIIVGLAGFICYDKLVNNKTTKCEKELKELKNKQNSSNKKKEEKAKDENKKEDTTTSDDSKHAEKVYADGNGTTIVLFKSGNCIVAGTNEFTPDCTYYIENNKVLLTRSATGPSDGSKKTYTYSISVDGSEEYLQSDDNQNTRFKCLKK